MRYANFPGVIRLRSIVLTVVSGVVLAFAAVGATPLGSSATSGTAKPNIIFVLTDDQDTKSLATMRAVQGSLVKRGKTFTNATFAQATCCPSRATILRGQYPHNTGVLGNVPPQGGYPTFKKLGRERSTYATWLDRAGYHTGYFGKYLNLYKDETHVPPGWDRWVAADHAPATMRISNDGKQLKLDDRYETFDLAMKDYSLRFLKNNLDKRRPLFMTVSFSAAHTERGIAKYEKRYGDRFTERAVPRPPNYNERDRSDKPKWVRELPAITPEIDKKMTRHHRARLRSLQTVDDAVEEYVQILWNKRELDNTYIFYFTDNGYHMGNHALPNTSKGIGGKNAPYTEDVEFPIIVRGPGISPNTKDDRLVSNTDLAPTFADIANASPTYTPDGRSLLPLMRGRNMSWRDALLVEARHDTPWPRGWMATYKQVRTKDYAYHYYPDTGEEELYDLEADPYQLESVHEDSDYEDIKATLRTRLEELKDCRGRACRIAEGR